MNAKRTGLRSIAAVLGMMAVASTAWAAPCYVVYDRGGDVIYRGVSAPFDGAFDPASPGRAAMRTRGEHLVYFEADVCAPVAQTGAAGVRPLTTDEIVAGFPTYAGRSVSAGAVVGSWAVDGAPGISPSGFVGPAARITAPANQAIQTRMGSYR